eukprot:4873774-Heterocapsa_arctica.AAC.1
MPHAWCAAEQVCGIRGRRQRRFDAGNQQQNSNPIPKLEQLWSLHYELTSSSLRITRWIR